MSRQALGFSERSSELALFPGWTSVFASEATFFVLLVGFWSSGAIPEAALRESASRLLARHLLTTEVVTIFLVFCLAVFLVPNKYFGWLEYFGSLVKVLLFFFITIISLAIIGGAGPSGYVRDGSTWTDLPAFKNGFGVSTSDSTPSSTLNSAIQCRASPTPHYLLSGAPVTRSSSESWVVKLNLLATPWHMQPI